VFKFNSFKRKRLSRKASQTGEIIENQLEIIIGDILVKIVRFTTTKPQNELTAVIPRAEIRRKCYKNGVPATEEEIILNSITLVDAPRHPTENRTSKNLHETGIQREK